MLAVDPGPDCRKVAAHVVPIMSGVSKKITTETALQECKRSWSAAMRECLLTIKAPMDVIACNAKATSTECEAAFSRLSQLAKQAGRSDASLAAKRQPFGKACSELSMTARKCLLDAPTLDAYKACKDVELVARAVGSTALGWEPPAIPGLTHWHVKEALSRMDDKRTVFAVRSSPETIPGSYREVRPSLAIRCEGKKLDVYINVNTQVQNEGLSDYRTTRVKIGSGKARRWLAGESTSGDALFMTRPKRLLRLLRGNDKLLFEFTPFQRTKTIVAFEIDGIDQVLAKMASCGVAP